MKIISRGIKPSEKIYRGTCHNCLTQFECQQHEGHLNHGDQRDGPFLEVNCPVCGSKAYAYERNDGRPIRVDQRDYLSDGFGTGRLEYGIDYVDR